VTENNASFQRFYFARIFQASGDELVVRS